METSIQAPARSALTDKVVFLRAPEESIRQSLVQIHQDTLTRSKYIRQANFTSIHPRDLEFLFGAYTEMVHRTPTTTPIHCRLKSSLASDGPAERL